MESMPANRRIERLGLLARLRGFLIVFAVLSATNCIRGPSSISGVILVRKCGEHVNSVDGNTQEFIVNEFVVGVSLLHVDSMIRSLLRIITSRSKAR